MKSSQFFGPALVVSLVAFLVLCSWGSGQDRGKRNILDNTIDVSVSGKSLPQTLQALSSQHQLRIIAEVDEDANAARIDLTKGKTSVGKIMKEIATQTKGVSMERHGVILLKKEFKKAVEPPFQQLIQNTEGIVTFLERLPTTLHKPLSEKDVLDVQKLRREDQQSLIRFLDLKEQNNNNKQSKQKPALDVTRAVIRFLYDPYIEILSQSGQVESRLFIRSGPRLLQYQGLRSSQDTKQATPASAKGE